MGTWKLASPTIVFGAIGAIGAAVCGVLGYGAWAAAAPVIATALAACFTDAPATVDAKVQAALYTPVPDDPAPPEGN